jgi:hypothetical protein
MANIRHLDMLLIDDFFEMSSGYVLNFSDKTFAAFFAELDIDIDDQRFARNGTSKAKRLRCFLYSVEIPIAVRVLKALWEYREVMRERSSQPEKLQNAGDRFAQLIARIQGVTSPSTHAPVAPAWPAPGLPSATLVSSIIADLIALSKLDPHPRGFGFEKFLKRTFDAYGLEARDAFRLKGEQIDGSFQLANETYLLEAKWQNAPSGVAELHVFHGKLEQKAAWARGLFISNSGFADGGLEAFGRGKRVVCMDGYDLYEVLRRNLPLGKVLERKVRHAAETGVCFARVRDLFPE